MVNITLLPELLRGNTRDSCLVRHYSSKSSVEIRELLLSKPTEMCKTDRKTSSSQNEIMFQDLTVRKKEVKDTESTD